MLCDVAQTFVIIFMDRLLQHQRPNIAVVERFQTEQRFVWSVALVGIQRQAQAGCAAANRLHAGHVVAQFAMAVDMLAECGIGRDNARSLLFPLLAGTVENLSQMPEKQALTGTFARGDAGTVERDLKAVDGSQVELAGEIFRALGRKALELADLPAEKKYAVEKILSMESPAAK